MINCIAIDDEPLALQQLELYAKKTPFLNMVALFESAIEALEYLREHEVDLMFVDIQMPKLTGMEFVKSLSNGPKVIFTTAYSEYAVEGFKVDALDYILKPIDYVSFLKSANKAHEYFDCRKPNVEEVELNDKHMFIKSEYKVVSVDVDKIMYIEGQGGYLKFHIEDSKSIMSLMSMKSLEERLPSTKFMRVHRSFLVNLQKISVVERGQIVFGKDRISISDQYKTLFQAYLDKHIVK